MLIVVPILSVSLLSTFEPLVCLLSDTHIQYVGPAACIHPPPFTLLPLTGCDGPLDSCRWTQLCQRSDWLAGGAFPFLNKCLYIRVWGVWCELWLRWYWQLSSMSCNVILSITPPRTFDLLVLSIGLELITSARKEWESPAVNELSISFAQLSR